MILVPEDKSISVKCSVFHLFYNVPYFSSPKYKFYVFRENLVITFSFLDLNFGLLFMFVRKVSSPLHLLYICVFVICYSYQLLVSLQVIVCDYGKI